MPKHPNLKFTIYLTLIVIPVTVICVLAVNYFILAWSEPSGAPPNGSSTQDLNLNNRKITNLTDPVNPQDAATRGWVVNYVTANAGGGGPKTCRSQYKGFVSNPDSPSILNVSGAGYLTGIVWKYKYVDSGNFANLSTVSTNFDSGGDTNLQLSNTEFQWTLPSQPGVIFSYGNNNVFGRFNNSFKVTINWSGQGASVNSGLAFIYYCIEN